MAPAVGPTLNPCCLPPTFAPLTLTTAAKRGAAARLSPPWLPRRGQWSGRGRGVGPQAIASGLLLLLRARGIGGWGALDNRRHPSRPMRVRRAQRARACGAQVVAAGCRLDTVEGQSRLSPRAQRSLRSAQRSDAALPVPPAPPSDTSAHAPVRGRTSHPRGGAH